MLLIDKFDLIASINININIIELYKTIVRVVIRSNYLAHRCTN